MGDDLNFAQKFTRTAADGLALLSEMHNPRAANDAAVVTDMMTTLQRGAKRLRARHIYASAQEVLSALHHEDDATLSWRINNLGALVTQYARGLEELLQAPNSNDNLTHADKWDMARETLNALLPIAAPETADMLSRLMRAPVTIDTVHPQETEAAPQAMQDDIVSSLPSDGLVEAFETEAPDMSSSRPADALDAPQVSLDAMMRDIIADALSVARSVDQTISLSYDMGDRMISERQSDDLRDRLGKALSQIIRQSLTNDRVGHIDINLAGEQLHIMAGTTALRVAIDPNAIPAKKPLITPETEQGLRAQLDALMDPSSLHETAS